MGGGWAAARKVGSKAAAGHDDRLRKPSLTREQPSDQDREAYELHQACGTFLSELELLRCGWIAVP